MNYTESYIELLKEKLRSNKNKILEKKDETVNKLNDINSYIDSLNKNKENTFKLHLKQRKKNKRSYKKLIELRKSYNKALELSDLPNILSLSL